MILSITEFATVAHDQNGNVLPMGKGRLACTVLNGAGQITLQKGTRFLRLATDTAIQMDIAGGSTNSQDEYFPVSTIEYLAVDGLETLTIALA